MSTKKPNNQLTDLIVNLCIPVIVLSFLSKEKFLGPLWGLIVAISIPVIYGTWILIREKRTDVFAIIGVISVFLTGIFGVFELPKEWIIYKETGVPLLLGILIIISLKTPFPFIKKVMLNDVLFDMENIHNALKEKKNEEVFDRKLVGFTWGMASSMFLSSVLNYVLAKILLTSQPGTEEFTAQLGKMTGLSYIVIVLPCLAVMMIVLWRLFNTLTTLTGLKFDDLLAEEYKVPQKDDQKEDPAT